MQDLIQQIMAANNAGLYYVSLSCALALPDMCGALESADGIATGAKYSSWFDRHVAPLYQGNLDGQTCYQFRCSMLHQGRTQHPRNRYARIMFLEPRPGLVLHNNVLNDALNIDVTIFCSDVCNAAERWFNATSQDANVIANMDQFVRRYPTGLPPYIVGLPVIS